MVDVTTTDDSMADVTTTDDSMADVTTAIYHCQRDTDNSRH